MTQELEGFHWQLGEDVKELLEQKLLSGKAAAFADEKGAFLARLGSCLLYTSYAPIIANRDCICYTQFAFLVFYW